MVRDIGLGSRREHGEERRGTRHVVDARPGLESDPRTLPLAVRAQDALLHLERGRAVAERGGREAEVQRLDRAQVRLTGGRPDVAQYVIADRRSTGEGDDPTLAGLVLGLRDRHERVAQAADVESAGRDERGIDAQRQVRPAVRQQGHPGVRTLVAGRVERRGGRATATPVAQPREVARDELACDVPAERLVQACPVGRRGALEQGQELPPSCVAERVLGRSRTVGRGDARRDRRVAGPRRRQP